MKLKLFTAVAALFSAVTSKPIPTISEQFSVKTTELDDTLNGTVSVRQKLEIDQLNRRSHMTADGLLAHGHLEEIIRCDKGWKTGYALTLGGPPGTNVSEWQCTNQTLNPSPSTCQWSNFWDMPSNASYVGTAVLKLHNGTTVHCDSWEYWVMNDKFVFSAIVNTSIPIRTAKVFTRHTGYHLWHIDFTDFISGSPPINDFNPPEGIKCSKPSPLSSDWLNHLNKTTVTQVSSRFPFHAIYKRYTLN